MDEDIQLIQNWLKETESDCSNKRPDEDIIEAIYSLIDDWKSNKEIIHKLCLRIFGFYRDEDAKSKVFSLQFIPSLMYAYLSGIAQGDKKDVGSIQTFLLAVYNIEAGEEAQSPKSHSFRVPNIAQPSIYHEPLGLASSSLTESALRRLDPANRIMVKFGPHPHLHSFNAENRLPALAALLRIYSHYLSMYSKISLNESCLAFSRLVAQGYTPQSEGSHRIPVSSQLLVEILQIIYSLTSLPISTGTLIRLHSPPAPPPSMEEGELANRARQSLEAVKQRVEVELVAAPLLVSAAVVDSSQLSIKRVSTSPQLVSSGTSGTARAMWKSMITNASFRTKKLPDDITVALVGTEPTTSTSITQENAAMTTSLSVVPALGAISEEMNDVEPSGGSSSNKVMNQLSSLVKKKNKPKVVKRSNNGLDHSNDSGPIQIHCSDWNSDGEEMELQRKFNSTAV